MTTADSFVSTDIMSKIVLLFALIFCGSSALAKAPVDNFSCHGKALLQKDCLLQLGPNKIQIYSDKILFGDGMNLITESIPQQGPEVVWQSLTSLHLAKRWFIDLTFWSPPEASTGIQTLNWYVFEIADGHVPLKLQKAIQKRVKNTKGKWRTDNLITHDLILKGGVISAQFGREKIVIK